MLIDEKITRRIASLAKLELTDLEIKEYSKDLTKILKWMEELKAVDVLEVEPITSITNNTLFEREDSLKHNIVDREQILSNAPDKEGAFFTVPKVIE